MSLSPQSQLLERNIDILSSGKCLVINPADSLFLRAQKDTALTIMHQYYDVFSQSVRTTSALKLDSRDLISRANGFEETVTMGKHTHVFAPFLLSAPQYTDIVIYMPKSKPHTQMLLAMAACMLTLDGRLYLVGENKGGIKSAGKLLEQYGPVQKLDSARHCSLLCCQVTAQVPLFDPIKWLKSANYELNGTEWEVSSLPGVFSHGELDAGTKLLLEKLPTSFRGSVLDFACGAGVIGSYIVSQFPHVNLTLSDVSALALYCTALSVNDNGHHATLIAANGLSGIEEKFDTIVTNPPFHTGVKTDYSITEAFVRRSPSLMKSDASMYMVANRFLPYPGLLSESFNDFNTLAQDTKFSVYLTSR